MAELEAGQTAPDFTLESSTGSAVTLSSLRGKPVVLYFYPKDDTPGCTVEAQDFRDLSKDFARAGVTVLGVSRDTVKSHCKFRDKYGLTFPLLSDEEGKVTEAYGVWQEKKMYGRTLMGIVRTTVWIDAQGKVARVWPAVRVAGHAKAVLDAVTGNESAGGTEKKPAAKTSAAKKAPATKEAAVKKAVAKKVVAKKAPTKAVAKKK